MMPPVARGHHNAAVHALRERREVDHFGADEADVVDVDPGIGQPARQRVAQRLTREADIAADHDATRLEPGRIGAADDVSDLFVDLVGHAPAQIVGFEGGNSHVEEFRVRG
jgi:hypothetical protein